MALLCYHIEYSSLSRSEYLSLLSYKHMLYWVLRCAFFDSEVCFICMFVHPTACLAGAAAWILPGLWLKRPSQPLFVSAVPGHNAQMPPTRRQWDSCKVQTWIDSLSALKGSSAYLQHLSGMLCCATKGRNAFICLTFFISVCLVYVRSSSKKKDC